MRKKILSPNDGTVTLTNDSAVRITDRHETTIEKVPVQLQVDLRNAIVSNTLIASNLVADVTDVPDTTMKEAIVGKFISKTFREKLLKEKTPLTLRLKDMRLPRQASPDSINCSDGKWRLI